MPGFLKARLRFMMFLQFFIWGAWYATAGNYMKSHGMSDVIYVAYLASPIGSIVAPFFLGMVADRFFAVQRVMGVMHILSGLFVFCAPLVIESNLASPPLFLTLLFLHMLCYMPTLGLATATAFHMLDDRERQFPLVRVFGTLGWILAGILVSFVWNGDTTGLPMRAAGIVGVLMGIYCFTLPNIPPPAPGTRLSFRDLLGLDALARLNARPVIVLLVSVLLTSIPLATYYSYVPVFLRAADIPNPAFKMTFGNMSEAIFLLLLPWFFRRMGVKWVLIIGMVAWMLRYALFAFGAPDAVTWVILFGILLHGACYDFVYVAGQVYMDRVSPPAIRAQAQGLFVLVSYGIGHGLGALAAGRIYNQIVTGDGQQALEQWKTFWLIPLVFATFVTVLFVFGSRTEEVPVRNESAPMPS